MVDCVIQFAQLNSLFRSVLLSLLVLFYCLIVLGPLFYHLTYVFYCILPFTTFLSILIVRNIFMLILYIFIALENDLGEVETSWLFIVIFYCKIDLKEITHRDFLCLPKNIGIVSFTDGSNKSGMLKWRCKLLRRNSSTARQLSVVFPWWLEITRILQTLI